MSVVVSVLDIHMYLENWRKRDHVEIVYVLHRFPLLLSGNFAYTNEAFQSLEILGKDLP